MKRNTDLDLIRAILIILMILIHIVNFGNAYPHLKAGILSFMMPTFLIITGYLVNIEKSPKQMGIYLMCLALPYVIMVSGFSVLSYFMPVRDGITELSFSQICEKIFVTSIGPYWFIQTMIICGILYYISFKGATWESLKLGLTALRNNRSILNHQLCNTLGMNQDAQIIPDATIADKTYGKEGEAYWQTAGTLNSPLLEQSSNAISIAEQKEKIAKSDLLPKVAFVAADNFDGPILFELPPVDKNLNVWYVGVGVKYSLSSLFKSNKRIKQAAVETRQAKEAHALQAEQLNNNVQAAYVQYQQTYVELETQRKSVELAQQNYDVMNARYLSQLALVTDMVDASNLKLNAELSEVDARINIVYAYYRMKYVAGEI